MIKTLSIKNFKSIRALTLDCKRLNIFIGQPNTGKSNILESLGLLSWTYYGLTGSNAKSFVRFEKTDNLFYDERLDDSLGVGADKVSLHLHFESGRFQGRCLEGEVRLAQFSGDHGDLGGTDRWPEADKALKPVKFYRFQVKQRFETQEADFLLPPSGDNLLSLLTARSELLTLADEICAPAGLSLWLRPQERRIEIEKRYADRKTIIFYPYHVLSDTLQRIIFYLAAILSNKESVLVFEEPESNTFPYYTKYLGELIAKDKNQNQYFISTHNPYFLLPLMQKTPQNDLAIFITYFKDYETKVKALDPQQLQLLTEVDIFSNLDMFLES